MKTCSDTLMDINQWHKDTVYVIGLMARRDAYFTSWDVTDLVGNPPVGCPFTVDDLLLEAENSKKIRYTGKDDMVYDGSCRKLWIGVKPKEE